MKNYFFAVDVLLVFSTIYVDSDTPNLCYYDEYSLIGWLSERLPVALTRLTIISCLYTPQSAFTSIS